MSKLEEAARALLKEWDADPCRSLPQMEALRAALAERDDSEVIGRHDGETDRRTWWSGGTWLYPGDEVVVRNWRSDAPQPDSELARALRVVEAARAARDGHKDTALALSVALEEWEAGK